MTPPIPGLVGRFNLDARTYQARTVQHHGEPTWMLGQLALMWWRSFDQDAAALCQALLERDWVELAHVDASLWPQRPGDADRYLDVTALGRGLRRSTPLWSGAMPTDPASDGTRWAYLWEHAGAALHVYATAYRRWHHLATVPLDLFEHLEFTIPRDIEARLGWVEETP